MTVTFNWSPSTIKKWKQCKFGTFCKITGKEPDTEVDNSYGDAGTLVHTVLEVHYRDSSDLPMREAIQEAKGHFEGLWEVFAETHSNPKIIKDEYWLSVINGIKLNLEADLFEKKFLFDDPVNFKGYADIINTKTDVIGDWKTSKYKAAKARDFKEQMRYYAWAYRKEYGRTPSLCWVLFNKVNKPFKWHFSDALLDQVDQELIDLQTDFEKRLKNMDFPRTEDRQACFFCQYKKLCSSDFMKTNSLDEIKFHLKGNKLVIEGSIPELVHKKIEAVTNYEVKNAHFIRKVMAKRGQKWDGIKRLYKRKAYGADCFVGYLERIFQIFKQSGIEAGKKIKFTIIDHRDKEAMNYTTDVGILAKLNIEFEMYDFQKKACDVLLNKKWGICEIGTGGGKTVIAAECIRRINGRTLFIIDNKDLLQQTKEEYEAMLGVKCGIVGMGLREWDFPIVLSTIQTLEKSVKEFSHRLAQFNVLIGDETHIWAAKSFEKISKHLVNTKYRLGFTATAKRDDGNTNCIFAHMGEIIYKKKAIDLIAEDVLVKPTAIFHKYSSKIVVADNWQNEYQSGIVENETRNNLIIKLTKEYAAEGKQIMILCTRVAHCKHFLEELGQDARLIFGKTEDDIRAEVRDDFKKGKFPILIGNLKIFNKGINIKNLDVLINAAGNAGDVTTIQTIGRALRKNPGKTEALYIDFIDNGEYLRRHSDSRIQSLRNEKYDVEIRDS